MKEQPLPPTRNASDPSAADGPSTARDTGHRQRQSCFEALLAPILSAAYGSAYHMTRSRDDAEDLVQEAALYAFRAFDTFQPGTNFKAWYFRILTNLFYQRHRRRQRKPEIAPLEDASELYIYIQANRSGSIAASADPVELVIGKMDTELVSRAIQGLPEEYRVVAALYFMEQFSYEEIADIVNCPVGTVRSRLHRGRKILQKVLWQLAVEQGIVAPPVTEES